MAQEMVEGGELIRRTSNDSSSSLNHSLVIMAVSCLTFSLRKEASIGSSGGTGTDDFLFLEQLEVFP